MPRSGTTSNYKDGYSQDLLNLAGKFIIFQILFKKFLLKILILINQK